MPKLEIELTPQVMSLLRQLKRTGLFGFSVEEIASRFVDQGVVRLLEKSQLLLKIPRRRPQK